MDFDKDFQNEVDMIAKNVEANFERNTNQIIFNKEELTSIIRMVVKEELQTATKDIKEYLKKTLDVRAQSNMSNEDIKEYSAGSATKLNIKPNTKVTYNILQESRVCSGMTCGGWTFFSNRKEGNHLWAVNEDGTEYGELYPKTISMVSKIEDGFVYFMDADYVSYRVSISSGKVERVNG